MDLTIDQQDIDPLLRYEPLQSSPVTSLQSSPATSLHSTMNIDRPSSPTYSLPQQPQQASQFEISSDERSLTYAEFTYSINLINNKINSIYQLCRFISDQQQQLSKDVKKLVAADELSDDFWKVFILNYFKVKNQSTTCVKILIFAILYR